MKNSIMIGIAVVTVGAAVLGLAGKREKSVIGQSTYSPYSPR